MSLKVGTILRVIAAYKSANHEDLTLEVGDSVELDEEPKPDDLKWHGISRSWGPTNGNTGYFPRTVVALDDETTGASIKFDSDPVAAKPPADGEALIGGVYEATFEFEPSKADELGLRPGEMVKVLEAPPGGIHISRYLN